MKPNRALPENEMRNIFLQMVAGIPVVFFVLWLSEGIDKTSQFCFLIFRPGVSACKWDISSEPHNFLSIFNTKVR